LSGGGPPNRRPTHIRLAAPTSKAFLFRIHRVMKFRAPQVPNVTVLLADPNAFTMRLLKDMCRECGVQRTVEAASAEDMTAAVAANPIDIMVVDQRILESEDGDGWTIIDSRIAPDGVAPVVMLFGLPMTAEITRARKHGIKLALKKPFSPKEFWLRLQWLACRSNPRILSAAARAPRSALPV
jgi:CheY-like chemotaxis protein